MTIDWTIIGTALIISGSIAALVLRVINAKKMTVITKEDWERQMGEIKNLKEITDKHEVWLTELRTSWRIEWDFIKKMLTEIKADMCILEKSIDELKKCAWSLPSSKRGK